MTDPVLILASASPRRRELLAQIGLACEVRPADIDETPRPDEAPAEYVMRLATEKARSVAAAWPGRPVLAADTTVVVDDAILGKPADRAEGREMLAQLSGRRHQVMTAICLVSDAGSETELVITEVSFMPLDDALCEAYLDTPEPWDKAGGYGIQGLAAVFVSAIEGSYSNVVGLPLHETWQMLRRAGVPTPPEASPL